MSRQLPINVSALQQLGFAVISVKQVMTKRPSRHGPVIAISLPLFLVTIAQPDVTEHFDSH
jgi:hypothetical protein